jgi:hypothetical protein
MVYKLSRDSSVSIATRLRAGRSGFWGSIPGGGWEFFSSLPRPERLWGPPSLLSNGYQGLFPWGKSGRGVKLTTHLHLVQRSKNTWSYTSTHPICLHGVVFGSAQGQLYLLPGVQAFMAADRQSTFNVHPQVAQCVVSSHQGIHLVTARPFLSYNHEAAIGIYARRDRNGDTVRDAVSSLWYCAS